MSFDNQSLVLRELQYENLSSLEISKRTGISQPTVSRLLKTLPVLKLGGGRSTVFALTTQTPSENLFQTNTTGQISSLGELYFQPEGRTILVNSPNYVNYEGLPYFLYDVLPAGFLGSITLKNIVANDPRLHIKSQDWSDAQIVHYLTVYGHDLPGNFILSGRMAQKAGTLSHTKTERLTYPSITHAINRNPENMGSSIAGEQPKFTVFNGDEHLIVKYSPLVSEEGLVATRHRDLIVCEHLALEALRENDINAAKSTLHIDARFYLEISRFDRIGDYGRKGMVSLKMLDAEYTGVNSSWIECGKALLAQKVITPIDFYNIEIAYAFGLYIANTDMHLGNFSFFMDGLALDGTTPIYDMLPMGFMPSQGEISERDFSIPRFINASDKANVKAFKAALDFWEKVMQHPDISKRFKTQSENLYQQLLRFQSSNNATEMES